MSLHLAIIVFPGARAAEAAYLAARRRAGDRRWTCTAAVVERDVDDDVLVTGTYGDPDLEFELEASGLTGDEGLMGSILGSCFGPSGRMAALLAQDDADGGSDGGPRELRGASLRELRAALGRGSSAIVLLARPLDVDEMVAAFHGSGARLLRRHLSLRADRVLRPGAASLPG